MKNLSDGTRMFLKSGVNDSGITLLARSFGIVKNGLLEVWSPTDQRAHAIMITSKTARIYPYPVARMVYNARQDRWAEYVPLGVGVLEALANARRMFIGLPLLGDTIDIANSDSGWQSSLSFLGVTIDANHQVLFTAYPTYSREEEHIRRLERMGYEFVAGGNSGLIHLGLRVGSRLAAEPTSTFCGHAMIKITQAHPVRFGQNNSVNTFSLSRVCKCCLRAVPTSLQ